MAICPACKEIITNPICQECLVHSFESWLLQNSPSIAATFNANFILFNLMDHGDCEVNCIKCNNHVSICMHCMALELYDWLKLTGDEFAIKTFPFNT